MRNRDKNRCAVGTKKDWYPDLASRHVTKEAPHGSKATYQGPRRTRSKDGLSSNWQAYGDGHIRIRSSPVPQKMYLEKKVPTYKRFSNQ